ncbi:hypothetical protein CerSpe_114780 [Prunus speciosa]
MRPGKEQRSNPPPTGGFVPYKQKHKSYSFDLSKAENIFDEPLRGKVIRLDEKHIFPKQEEVKGKLFCKWHNSFSHAINNCVQFRDAIQDLINEGKILLDKPATMRVDNEPFPTHMVGVNWPERHNKRKIVVDIEKAGKVTSSSIERPKATITAGIVMCSRCKCECKLEIPAAGWKIDERLIQNRIEADQNFHRSEAWNYSPFSPHGGTKGNYERFREISGKVVQEPYIPRRAGHVKLEDRDEWRTRLVRPESGASSAQPREMRAQDEGNNRPSIQRRTQEFFSGGAIFKS